MSNLAREHESHERKRGFEPLESSHLVGQDNPKKTQKATAAGFPKVNLEL